MVPAIDFLDDAIGVGGPHERRRFAVMLAEIAVDRGLQIDQRAEDATLQPPAGEGGKKAFNGIGPGARGWGEVKRPAWVTSEPGADLGMFVNGVVVENDVDELAGRDNGLDPIEEADEFLMAVARHALVDDRAIEDIERREQRRRAPRLREGRLLRI